MQRNTVGIGAKAKSCFAENLIPDLKLVFVLTVSQYKIENMPFGLKLLKDV